MIVSFRDRETEEIYRGNGGKAARRRLPESLWRIAVRKMDQMDTVRHLPQLNAPSGNSLEVLKGDRKGQHSIRINDQFRICFRWTEKGPADVEIVDYH
jgi:toxin HigB-1